MPEVYKYDCIYCGRHLYEMPVDPVIPTPNLRIFGCIDHGELKKKGGSIQIPHYAAVRCKDGIPINPDDIITI